MAMADLRQPQGKRRALVISIRHVHRESSLGGQLANLEFAHRDAEELCDALTASHGYPPNDIILMKDEKTHPEHLWPTHAKILHQIDQLITDAPEDCHFFFYYSGHGLEVKADSHDRAGARADGREDEIISADGKPILDYILHDRLITPLEGLKGAKLIALFDCCHSETLLDLRRGKGPNQYSREWNVGPGQMFKDSATVIVNLLKLSKKCCGRCNSTPSASGQAISKLSSPPAYKAEEVGELDVICLSACRDGQLAHDDCELGVTFTQCFLNVMAARPNITWTELRNAVKELISEIETRYEETYRQSWMQEPMLQASFHSDLTRSVTDSL